MTAQELYDLSVTALPKSEKLRLATLILQELSTTAGAALDYSETWTEEDMREWTEHSKQYASIAYPEPDDATT